MLKAIVSIAMSLLIMYLSIHQIILACVEGDQLKPVNYEAIEPAGPCTFTFHYLPDRTRFAIFVQVPNEA